MRVVVIAGIFCAVLCIVSSKTETEPGKPPVHTVIEGDNLLLVCNATETRYVEIFWKKNDTKHPFREDGTELKFININRTFAGDYICYSLNLTALNETEANATVVEVVKIDVLYPAKVTAFSLAPDVVTENKTFTINCTIEGNPIPLWSIMNNRTKQAMLISTSASSVSVTSWPSQCRDAGFWMCSGYNKLNHNVNSTQGRNITVLCAPKPNMPTSNYTIKSRPGKAAIISMKSDGYPYPNYTWTHNGEVIHSDMQYDDGPCSFINISSVTIPDFGEYTLTMSNYLGSYVSHLSLIPYGPAEPSTNLTFSHVTSTGVTLHWISHFDMWKRQQFWIERLLTRTSYASIDSFYDNSTNHGEGNHLSYVVAGLQPLTHYELVVAVETPGDTSPPTHTNHHQSVVPIGYISYTNTVNFTTKAASPSPSPTPHPAGYHRNAIIIGCSVGGGIALLALSAFLVYLVKYRRLQTSYGVMKGKGIN